MDICFAEFIQPLKQRTQFNVCLCAYYYAYKIGGTIKSTPSIIKFHVTHSSVFKKPGTWNYTQNTNQIASRGYLRRINDGWQITERGLTEVDKLLKKKAVKKKGATNIPFEKLLHNEIRANALERYLNGHYRDAVFNAIVAVFDIIRTRTKLDLDGENLVNEAFSLNRKRLILSDLETTSGKDEQVGFMNILKGAYTGIRNPKAHSLVHDLDAGKAAQYLVFASLLARRVSEAKMPASPNLSKTVTQLLADSPIEVKNNFDKLKSFILSLGEDVQMKTLKYYFAFKRSKNFACVDIQRSTKSLLVYLKIKPRTIDFQKLNKGFARDVSNIEHFGTGDLEVRISSVSDLETAKLLIPKSYDVC